jgi:arylsulfatase A-like enzyme
MTDDQGYGDVAAHGNKMIQTPSLDELYEQSVRLTNFHVDPTCSPTRSALMSGRYSTRTGVWHTIMGRSLMDTNEVTIAEVLKAKGYRTAMFGKWHLGDNYPCRPHDQGFDETFYCGGGGVTQTPDFFGNDYFDDTYFRNAAPEKADGYCTDVWFREALKFIKKNKDRPFFVYLPTNAAHGPFLVADKYSKPYRDQGVPSAMAAFYGMITNIDENMGRLMDKLKEWNLEDDTILIFMTDNGTAAGVARGRRGGQGDAPGWRGFNAGMRGQKGSEYDGGHRVPFFVRWPAGGIGGGRDVSQLAAHIDVLPTIAEMCGAEKPANVALDGRSLVPLLKSDAADWPERTILVHSQRIEYPEKWRKCAVMTDRWRLVNGNELYDMQADPGQTTNIADGHEAVVNKLRAEYEAWWQSLSPVFDKFVRIAIGADAENPANLTCHDWHTENGPVPWNQGHIRNGLMANGSWAVDVVRDGNYEITLRRWPKQLDQPIEATEARLKIGEVDQKQSLSKSATSATFKVKLKKGQTRIETRLTDQNGKTRGAYFLEARYLD